MTTAKTRARKARATETTTSPYSFFTPDTQFAAPEAARDFTAQAMDRAKAGFEHYATNAAEAADVLAEGYKTAARQLTEANLKMLDTARDNFNAAVEAVRAILSANSISDAMQAQTTFVRERFNANLVQANEIAAAARQVANDTAAPARELFQRSLEGWKQPA